MTETIKISNEQTLKSGIKDLVIAALGARGVAHLKNCVLTDDTQTRVEFQVTLTKARDHTGNEVIFEQPPIQQKRQHFSKDLDKLISGAYVLFPRTPSKKLFDAFETGKITSSNFGDFEEFKDAYDEMVREAGASE